MKYYFLFLLIILFIILPIPPYIECNNLTIISKIEVNCSSLYDITYYEVIPIKEDNGIKYKYKKYNVVDYDLRNGLKDIESHKHIYKDKAKYYISCSNKDEIIKIIKET